MKKIYSRLAAFIIIILLPNCEELLDDYFISEEEEEEIKLEAEALVDQANEVLFDDLRIIMDDSEDIEEELESDSWGSSVKNNIDLSSANQKYTEALNKDPDNKGANFGKGFMEVAMASQDELLETTLNQWAECFSGMFEEVVEPTESEMPRSIISNNEYKMGIPQSGEAFFSFDVLRILDYLPIITSHENVLNRNEYDCPEIDTIQDLLENVFLDRISTAIDHLDKVVGTGFTFTITPTMLGDTDQESIELDDTEIYLMKALMHQLRAMIYAVITYNVNVPYYDLIEHSSTETRIGMPGIDYNWQWLAQDSDFLTIRSGQESSWPNTHSDLNNVLNSIESAWTFLKADTNTDYDVILLEDITDMENEMENEIDTDINKFLEEAREALNEDYEATFRSEVCTLQNTQPDDPIEKQEPNCYYTDSLQLTINIKNFLTIPPQNLKEIIPSYTIQTGICENEEWNDETNQDEIIEWGCPEFSWVATDCESWKSDWDITIGGLFPNMTPTKFFDELMKLDAEDCEDILERGLDF